MVVLRLIFVSLFLFHSLSLCSKLLLQQNMNFSALATVRLSVELKNTFILISYILTDFNMDEFAFLNFLLLSNLAIFMSFVFLPFPSPYSIQSAFILQSIVIFYQFRQNYIFATHLWINQVVYREMCENHAETMQDLQDR